VTPVRQILTSPASVFDAESTNGTTYGTNNTGGLATINLTGNGIYEQTGTGSIALGTNFYVNFGTASLGQFSLLNASAATLDGYITSGNIEINGAVDTNTGDYNVIGAPTAGPGQGIIELATPAVPEPSTWAMLLSGALILVGFQRFSRKSAV
jgi:hypothetical protein